MFDKAGYERKIVLKESQEKLWSLYHSDPIYKTVEGVTYKLQKMNEMADMYGDYWYRDLGFYRVIEYKLRSEKAIFDFSFLNPQDDIQLRLKEDIDDMNINIKSSNIRYARFNSYDLKCFDGELCRLYSHVPSSVNINIDVDTCLKDLKDSLKIFEKYNNFFHDNVESINFKNVDNVFVQKVLRNYVKKLYNNIDITFRNESYEELLDKYYNLKSEILNVEKQLDQYDKEKIKIKKEII